MATGLPSRFNAASFFIDRHVADGRGGRTLFRFAGRRLTYSDVADASARCANALAELGVEVENRVVIALPDVPAFAVVFWAAARVGAIAVPVNPLLSAADHEFGRGPPLHTREPLGQDGLKPPGRRGGVAVQSARGRRQRDTGAIAPYLRTTRQRAQPIDQRLLRTDRVAQCVRRGEPQPRKLP